jgi:hypothetical protein
LDLLDFKAPLARTVLRVIQALLDLREMLVNLVTTELLEKTDFQVPQARNLALLDLKDWLDHQAMTALRVKMELLVQLVLQAKMDLTALPVLKVCSFRN